MNNVDFKYMKEALATELAELLSKDMNLSVQDSLRLLYNSATYSGLKNPKTGLYFQSAGYVYSYLKSELTTGKLA